MNVRSDGKAAKEILLVELGNSLQRFGFPRKPRQQSFSRKLPDRTECVHVSFIPHSDDIDLTVDIALRLNVVEDLVNAFDLLRRDNDKRNSMTLGGELGNLSIG
jgi:hypothetical protein